MNNKLIVFILTLIIKLIQFYQYNKLRLFNKANDSYLKVFNSYNICYS